MKILPPKVKKIFEIWQARGFAGISNRLREIARRRREERNYRRWIDINQITEKTRAEIRNQIAAFAHKPLISIILPVYSVEEKWLRLCIESVLRQLYENWELCIADDKSPGAHVRRILEEYAARDNRVKVVFRETNGHISAASNSALELAAGEFCLLLDHDDELTEDALFYVAKELNEFPETAFVYSDEDMIDERGQRFYPKFKPDFSRDFFYSLNLITHLSAYRTEILRKIGGFRVGLEGSQDYDLALRFIEETGENRVRHIPKILYHWRAITGSVALSSDEKPYAHERARQ
jgi:O-antigen biosynthesis protein